MPSVQCLVTLLYDRCWWFDVRDFALVTGAGRRYLCFATGASGLVFGDSTSATVASGPVAGDASLAIGARNSMTRDTAQETNVDGSVARHAALQLVSEV